MGDQTGIEWTDATFNPWWGCMKVSPGCDNCYAETWANRYGFDVWGPHATYRTFGDKHWNEPVKWNAAAQKSGIRKRVFCASMADVFDNRAPVGARDRLWSLIRATPFLDWQLLTKRIENVPTMLPADWDGNYHNVWLIASAVTQAEVDRIMPRLFASTARIAGLSIEPMLELIDLGKRAHCLDWVICGGESGPGARPMHQDWARSLRDQCRRARVPFFFKQWGGVNKKAAGRLLDGETWSQFP